MGYIRHHAIAVTSWNRKKIKKARKKAKEIFEITGKRVSGLLVGEVNSYLSFFISPDGSKEGWEDSDRGDKKREEFIGYLEAQKYEEDGSNCLSYCEFYYGDSDGGSEVERHN